MYRTKIQYNKSSFIQKSSKKQSGFVILFSVLISSTILLISAGIFNISQKEAILSSFSRESQRALYASNSALECALYHDVNPPIVNGIKKTAFPIINPIDTTIECSGSTLNVTFLSGKQSDDFTYLYTLNYQNTLSKDVGCSFVLVEKKYADINDPLLGIDTRVTTVGFNSCSDGKPNYLDPNILERRLSATYRAF